MLIGFRTTRHSNHTLCKCGRVGERRYVVRFFASFMLRIDMMQFRNDSRKNFEVTLA